MTQETSREMTLRTRICKYIILHRNKEFTYLPCIEQYSLESQNVRAKRDLMDHLCPLADTETGVQGGNDVLKIVNPAQHDSTELMLDKELWP